MKEAYSKGLGSGLASPMDSYSVMPAGQSQVNATPAQVRLGSWVVTSLRPAAGYVGAVAVTAGAMA